MFLQDKCLIDSGNTFHKLSIHILSEYPQYIYTTDQKFGDSNTMYYY